MQCKLWRNRIARNRVESLFIGSQTHSSVKQQAGTIAKANRIRLSTLIRTANPFDCIHMLFVSYIPFHSQVKHAAMGNLVSSHTLIPVLGLQCLREWML